MKKYGKLLTKISLIVLAVSLFLSLSLSDVIPPQPAAGGRIQGTACFHCEEGDRR